MEDEPHTGVMSDFALIATCVIIALGLLFYFALKLVPEENERQVATSGAMNKASVVASGSTAGAPTERYDVGSEPNPVLSLQDGIQIDGRRVFWVMDNDGAGTLCVPAVSFIVRNESPNTIDHLAFNAQFLLPEAHKIFAAATVYWSSSDPGPLPPGYMRGVVLHAPRGFEPASGRCSPESLAAKHFDVLATVEIGRSLVTVVDGHMASPTIMFHGPQNIWEDLAEQAEKKVTNGPGASTSR